MKNMRHVVRVLRPTTAQGTRGQTQGAPTVIFKEWPCSIRTLTGREVEQARTVYAEATDEVSGYGDPNNPIFERDYLEIIGRNGPDGKPRRLYIGFVNDKQNNGVELTLTCGERTGG